MEYKLESSSYFDAPEELLEEYPYLKDYSFEIKETQIPINTRIQDENGKYIIQQVGYKTLREAYIHITSLANLMKFITDVGYCVIVSTADISHEKNPTIEIYDGYRE